MVPAPRHRCVRCFLKPTLARYRSDVGHTVFQPKDVYPSRDVRMVNRVGVDAQECARIFYLTRRRSEFVLFERCGNRVFHGRDREWNPKQDDLFASRKLGLVERSSLANNEVGPPADDSRLISESSARSEPPRARARRQASRPTRWSTDRETSPKDPSKRFRASTRWAPASLVSDRQETAAARPHEPVGPSEAEVTSSCESDSLGSG